MGTKMRDMTDKYILNEVGEIAPESDVLKWAKWFENISNRKIAFDVVRGQEVSSVFLGIDHRFHGQGDPILFETMIFGGPHDGWQARSATKNGILDQHKYAVEMCLAVGFWGLFWWNIKRTMNGFYEKCREKNNRIGSAFGAMLGMLYRNGLLVRAKGCRALSLLRKKDNR